MWLQMIVDPPTENRGFHRRRPRLRQCFHPAVQIEAGGGNRSFAVNRATAILYAVADGPLVHIQSNVIHRFHGGASLVFLNQRPLRSAFLHQTLLLRPVHSNLPGTTSELPVSRPESPTSMEISGWASRSQARRAQLLGSGQKLPWEKPSGATLKVRLNRAR